MEVMENLDTALRAAVIIISTYINTQLKNAKKKLLLYLEESKHQALWIVMGISSLGKLILVANECFYLQNCILFRLVMDQVILTHILKLLLATFSNGSKGLRIIIILTLIISGLVVIAT